MEYLPLKMFELIDFSGERPEMVQTTLTFDQIMIKAVYFNMTDVVMEMAQSRWFNRELLDDIGISEAPFPLYYITLCYKRVMWGDFIDEVMPVVLEHRKRIDDLLAFWEERFGVDIHQTIDYKKYWELFFCADENESLKDVLLCDPQKYLDNGCRMIDLELFEAVEKFQFERVKDLLEKGADPDANLIFDGNDKDDYLNCLERIGNEIFYLSSCEVFPMLEEKKGEWFVNYDINKDNAIGNLFGWAAHEDMNSLLMTALPEESDFCDT